MNNKLKLLQLFIVLITTATFAQMQEYDYKRKISEVSQQWHKIELPNAIFSEVQTNLADIRVFGVTVKDTIEAPYVLKQLVTENETVSVPFKMRNKSHNANGYYYTFKTNDSQEINQLFLDFKKNNFDWKIKLEASENHKEWFTIVDDYRIMAIKNESVNYQFTKVIFPKSKYTYYRLLVKTPEDPKLTRSRFNFKTIKKGKLQKYTIANSSKNNDKKIKKTTVYIELDTVVAINQLQVNIANTTDYYRHYTLSYLSNRFKTEKGWIENYTRITSGVLNSIADNNIQFNSAFSKKLKLEIDNQDNAPLEIASYNCLGYVYQLTVRFDKKADYFLVNGRKNDRSPNYDIVKFNTKIPQDATLLTLRKAVVIEKPAVAHVNALFENKIWLWAIMLVIIGLLGWFSVKMMKEKA